MSERRACRVIDAADTDEAGHVFQSQAGLVFRSEAGHPWLGVIRMGRGDDVLRLGAGQAAG